MSTFKKKKKNYLEINKLNFFYNKSVINKNLRQLT